jgi:hypothetical protein
MNNLRTILILGFMLWVQLPCQGAIIPVTLELVAGTAGTPVMTTNKTKVIINLAAAVNSPTNPPRIRLSLFPVVQGRQPSFVSQSPNGQWRPEYPSNMIGSGDGDPAFYCWNGFSRSNPPIGVQGNNWVVDIYLDDNLRGNAAFWRARQPTTYVWLIDDGSGSGSLQQGFAQQQRGTPIFWQESPTTTLRRRFNPKTGRGEVTKNGVITRKGYLNLAGNKLNRRQALRNYRYR